MRKRLTALVFAACLLLGGCVLPKAPECPYEPVDFTRITITEQGDDASTWQIEVLRQGTDTPTAEIAIYRGSWEFDDTIDRGDCRVICTPCGHAGYLHIAQKLGEYGVLSWDGFHESDPDGKSFCFEMELPDGEILTTSGTNAFPAHYEQLVLYLKGRAWGEKIL